MNKKELIPNNPINIEMNRNANRNFQSTFVYGTFLFTRLIGNWTKQQNSQKFEMILIKQGFEVLLFCVFASLHSKFKNKKKYL